MKQRKNTSRKSKLRKSFLIGLMNFNPAEDNNEMFLEKIPNVTFSKKVTFADQLETFYEIEKAEHSLAAESFYSLPERPQFVRRRRTFFERTVEFILSFCCCCTYCT